MITTDSHSLAGLVGVHRLMLYVVRMAPHGPTLDCGDRWPCVQSTPAPHYRHPHTSILQPAIAMTTLESYRLERQTHLEIFSKIATQQPSGPVGRLPGVRCEPAVLLQRP